MAHCDTKTEPAQPQQRDPYRLPPELVVKLRAEIDSLVLPEQPKK